MNYKEALAELMNSVENDLDAQRNRAEHAEGKSAVYEAELLSRKDLNGLLSQGQELFEELKTWVDVNEAAKRLVQIEGELRHWRGVNLPASKDNLEAVVADATMAAYAENVITGKNQSERDVQLTAYLAKDLTVIAARNHLFKDNEHIVDCEARLAVAEAEHKGALNRWNAARAQAELLAAMLTAVAGR